MKKTFSKICLVLGLCVPVGSSVVLMGCAGNRYERSTGEYIDDKTLHVRVKSALADNPQFKFGDVNVTSFRGVVQLSGFVNTSEQKKTAEMIAERVHGVRSVENNITVKDRL